MTDKQKELVKIAQEWYKGHKTMSDQEFDRMENEVKQEDPDFDYRRHLHLDGVTVKHRIKFPPLKKPQIDKYDLEKKETQALLKSLDGKGYKKTPKLSGCSLVIYYDKDGKLEDIITKSNDYDGKRKIDNFIDMVPNEVTPGVQAISCEAIVELDKGYGDNSEAKANGLVNSKSMVKQIQGLITLVAWDVYLYPDSNLNKNQVLEELRHVKIPQFKVIEWEDFDSSNIGWDRFYKHGRIQSVIDGYVIYSKNHNVVTALKFYFNDSKEVIVKGFEWNLSDKLGLIPKIKYDQIIVEGKKNDKCASNGIQRLIDDKIGKGAKILIAVVNGSSPQCVKVLEPAEFKFPQCPTCKTQLTKDDILKSVLYCSNPYCKDKLNWMKHHIGAVNIDKFYNNTDKYTIDACNLSSFNKNKKRLKRWIESEVDQLIEAIKSEDAKVYYELIKSHYDLNNENRKKAKLLIPSLLRTLKQLLNI